VRFSILWLHEPNLNQRPSGSEPKGKGLALFEQALANKHQRPSGYEPKRSLLSLADSVVLTLATGLKTLYSRLILCPSLTQVLPELDGRVVKSIRGVLSAYLS
jgi:hypothetical protein